MSMHRSIHMSIYMSRHMGMSMHMSIHMSMHGRELVEGGGEEDSLPVRGLNILKADGHN